MSASSQRRLQGQKALVTGAATGIGRACALALAKDGADVLVNWHRHDQAAAAVVDEIHAEGVQGDSFQADVSNEDQVLEMFNHVRSRFGTLDILVNNAGIQKDAPFTEMTCEDWDQVMAVNLRGQFLCAREAVKEFKKKGVVSSVSAAAGKVICMSSVHQLIPWSGHVNYAASKGGVSLLMQSLAQECAVDKIRVNAIAPGAIKTGINRQAWEKAKDRRELLKLIPYGRVGEADEIGRIAAWLASDEADYLTGATLCVDGGMALYPSFAGGGG